MTSTRTHRQVGLLCLLSCAASGYLLYIDRHTALGLQVVELQSLLPIPIPACFAVIGVALIAYSLRQNPPSTRSTHRGTTQRRRENHSSVTRSDAATATAPMAEGQDWWSHVRVSCNQISLPTGASVTLHKTRPCPVHLRLEMAPPDRCKRAIQAVAEWFSHHSIPPRFRIEFHHCPEGPSPRHHMVNGAIATHISRGDFKVITDRDAVDVLFHRPDPRWNKPESMG